MGFNCYLLNGINFPSSKLKRGTQQTVSVNICSEDLLSPTIFGLKCDEKLEVFLAQVFVIWGVTPVVSER